MSVPFLTDLDPNFAVTGSRDPLGTQAIWGAVGRELVGNLTLASNDVAGFRTLLIGYGLAGSETSLERRKDIFLRWEQAAAACRVAADRSDAPLGALRVRRRLGESRTMLISETEEVLLRDQRATGLWTLYHRAALSSGLVDKNRGLTAAGQELFAVWNKQVPEAVVKLVLATGVKKLTVRTPEDAPTEDARTLANLLTKGSGALDRKTLSQHLVCGRVTLADDDDTKDQTGGRQRALAALLKDDDGQLPLRDLVPDLQQRAQDAGEDTVASRLDQIRVCESVLVPAQCAFDYVLLAAQGTQAAVIAKAIDTAWAEVPAGVRADDFAALDGALRPAVGRERCERWVAVARHMAAGDWLSTVGALVEINSLTMARRGGGPWVQARADGSLSSNLMLGTELDDGMSVRTQWRNPYYLTSLLQIHHGLRGGRR